MPRRKADLTMDVEFEFRLYTKRWGHLDPYRLTRRETGWQVDFLGANGVADKGGRDILYQSLDQDGVEYPASLPDRLEFLWELARSERLTKRQVQGSLNRLARWIGEIEYRRPKGPVWERFG